MKSALVLLLLGTSALAQTYAVDPKLSELVVKTKKDGFAAVLAHNHVIKATEYKGELTFDPAAPERAALSITIQAASLVPDAPALRKKHGEPGLVSASDQRKVIDAMLDTEQLDVRKFPTISFVSTAFLKDDQGWQVSGRITLHGVTKSVKVPVKIVQQKGSVTGDAVVRLRTSDFGVKPYSAALGTIKNKDEVELVVHLVASTQPISELK